MEGNKIWSLSKRLTHCPNPSCGKKEFKGYVNEAGTPHPDRTKGRCNRESKCGYESYLKGAEFFDPDGRTGADAKGTQGRAYGRPFTRPQAREAVKKVYLPSFVLE